MLSLDKGGNIGQRSWAVERVHGNQIRENSGLQFAHVLLHTWTFVLKDTDGVTALKELVGFGIVDGKGICIELYAVLFFHDFDGVLDQGEGL